MEPIYIPWMEQTALASIEVNILYITGTGKTETASSTLIFYVRSLH